MGTLRRLTLYVFVFVVGLAMTPAARADVAGVYQKTMKEVDTLEAQLAKAVAARDVEAFISHFAVSDADKQKLRGWFETTCQSWKDADLDHVEAHLPLLAASPERALVHLGHIDVHSKSGEKMRHGWPPLVLERRDGEWVIILEALSPLDPVIGVEVTHAEFDVAPQLESNGMTARAVMTVENKAPAPMGEIDVQIQHPLVFEETTLDGRPLEADVSFGEIAGRPIGLLKVKMDPPLAPGASAKLGFRYSASYDYHNLGRKPIGFTGDRGFILWESGWYPHFNSGWNMFPYDMKITVPRGYKALTCGELVDERDEKDTHVCTYRTTRPEPPFFLWGRYKETPCPTGNVKMTIWTPIEGDIDPQPMAKLVGEAFDAFSKILPPPALKHHRVVAVTRYGGYGATGNLLLYDPTFSPESIAKTSTLDFVAHELSHSWVNSLAAPGGDPPSLLAEGLATYLGAKAVELSRGGDAAREVWSGNLAKFTDVAIQAVAPMDLTERIRDENNPMFRGVAYDKGAYMFRELEALGGEKIVFRALAELMREHKDDRFALDDFTKRIDKLAKKDLSPFWKGLLHEAVAADYALEAAGEGETFNRVRVFNQGTIMPTPVEIAAYDADGHELARERVVIDKAEGRIVEFKAAMRIARVVIDPDARVCQGETRNDAYPDCVLPKEDVAAIESMLKRVFASLRGGDFDALSGAFAKDPELLETATRERMLAGLKRILPLAITENGPIHIYRTGEGRGVAMIAVEVKQGEAVRSLTGEFTLAKAADGWKLVMVRIT